MRVRVYRTETSWPVTTAWTLVSALTTVISLSTLFQDEWFVREAPGLRGSYGPVYFCDRDIFLCVTHVEPESVASARQLTCVLYGGGGILLAICVLFATCVFLLPKHRWRHHIFRLTGLLQLIAVILQGVGLILFPLSLDSSAAKWICGRESAGYRPGECGIGWAYLASLFATLNAIYCPILSRLAVYRVYEPDEDPWSNLNFM